MPRRQSVGTVSVVERSDECSEMVSGIVANGSVTSRGPNDVVFEDILFHYALETMLATGAQPVMPGIKNDVEWTALAVVRPDNEHDTWTEHSSA